MSIRLISSWSKSRYFLEGKHLNKSVDFLAGFVANQVHLKYNSRCLTNISLLECKGKIFTPLCEEKLWRDTYQIISNDFSLDDEISDIFKFFSTYYILNIKKCYLFIKNDMGDGKGCSKRVLLLWIYLQLKKNCLVARNERNLWKQSWLYHYRLLQLY